MLFYIPESVNAGFFSIFTNFFGQVRTVGIETKNTNSQTMPLLQAAVNIDPNPAKGGGDITIVGGNALLYESGPSGTIVDVQDKTENGHVSIYVVRDSDSLNSIAKMFGVSANTIVWANDIKNKKVTVGQTLIILPISGVTHTIVKGDTIKSIGKRYNADATEIAQYNDLQEDAHLTVGDKIIIPDGEVTAPVTIKTITREKTRVGTNISTIETAPTNYIGYFIRPISGGRKTQGLHGYNGVDLASEIGTPIMAAADGDVIVSRNYGWNGGYGNYIVIQHDNGTQTLYGHLSENLVFAGYHVVKGQIIAKMGNTGMSTGSHLHFEVRGGVNPF